MTDGSIPRPRAVTVAVWITVALCVVTLVGRLLFAIEMGDRSGREGLIVGSCLEGLVLGPGPLVIALLALRPRPLPMLLLRVMYVVWIVDALLWLGVGTPAGLVVSALAGSGHGGSSDRSDAILAFTAGRALWVSLKIAVSIGLFVVVHRHGGRWVREHRAARG